MEIDARGLRCPWPALRLARALRESPAATIVLLADDPAAAVEAAAVAAAHGCGLNRVDATTFRIVRQPS